MLKTSFTHVLLAYTVCSAEVTGNGKSSNWKEEGKSPVSLVFVRVSSDSRKSDLKKHARAER